MVKSVHVYIYTDFAETTVDFSRIQTGVLRDEGEHADH